MTRGAGLPGLVVALLLGLTACRPEAPPVPAPQPGVDVRGYVVDLSLDPASLHVEGRVVLDVRLRDSVRTLRLALAGPEATAVTVDGAAVAFTQRGASLSVPLPPRDSLRVAVVYAGVPSVGVYAEGRGRTRVVFTDGWPARVAGWLPGVHHPSDPATLDLTLSVPVGPTAIASGVPAEADTVDGRVRTRWRLDAPAPTYTFAFAAGAYGTVERAFGDTLVVRHHTLVREPSPADAAALDATAGVLSFFEALLGPYRYASYASADVPIPWAGMENAALAFLQAGLDAPAAADVQVHEVAHHWFGNGVTIAGWRDLWLSEGVASYLSVLHAAHAHGADAARARLAAAAALTPERLAAHHALVPAPPVEPWAHLGWVPYDKGASVLHLLRLAMGDAAFRAGLRDVYRRHAGRALTTEAFLATMQGQVAEDLGPLAAYWVYGTSLPRLTTAWEPAARRLRWAVEDDGGTLAGLSFELEVQQADRVRYVDVRTGGVVLDGPEVPVVRPVGVPMHVE